MIPEGRTERYGIWRACERFGILPPGTVAKWEDCDIYAQAALLAYDQVRQQEDNKLERQKLEVIARSRI